MGEGYQRMEKQTNINRFFEVIFPDPGAAFTSITDALKGKESTEVIAIFPNEQRRVRERFCINSLYPDKDLNPTDFWHRPDNARRADINVTVFRNILIECDKKSIEEQIEWLNNSSMPYTAVVHSGTKSLHIIISLEKPLRNKADYTRLCSRLYSTIAYNGLPIDETCKNPSRLSRYPGVIRSSSNKEQELLFIGNRVDNGILNTWIKQREPKKIIKKSIKKRDKKDIIEKYISNTTNKLIKEHQYYTESRHEAFKRAAVQLRKSGYEIEDIEALLLDAYNTVIPERNELGLLLKWVGLNIIPED